jgi:hypothetical protein
MISSPAFNVVGRTTRATRLIPSVVPRVKITSRSSAALMRLLHGPPGGFVRPVATWLSR